MGIKQIAVQRFSVTSSKSFGDIVAALDAAIGHPDMNLFRRDVTAAKTYAELEDIVRKAVGSSDLMEFTRFEPRGNAA